jgi:hypothetical protein
MITNENTVIELHSEQCRCHGYGWNARRKGKPVRTACCREDQTAPDGAVWVDSGHWLALGMPRTAESYYRAEAAAREKPSTDDFLSRFIVA